MSTPLESAKHLLVHYFSMLFPGSDITPRGFEPDNQAEIESIVDYTVDAAAMAALQAMRLNPELGPLYLTRGGVDGILQNKYEDRIARLEAALIESLEGPKVFYVTEKVLRLFITCINQLGGVQLTARQVTGMHDWIRHNSQGARGVRFEVDDR